jgi:hypothetical protein
MNGDRVQQAACQELVFLAQKRSGMHKETEVPPQDRLMQSLFAFRITKAVSAAASLKVADA